jgi:ribosomal protein S18 acetylase RimI-like enzyme
MEHLASDVADTVLIRLAEPHEYPAIGTLSHAAYTNDYDDLSAGYQEQLRHPESLLPSYDVWVAADEQTGELLGTVSILRQGLDDEGRIGDDGLYFRLLAVSPTARGRGIGKALTEFALGQAAERGSARVVLHSGDNMLGAHALYTKLGFTRRTEREMVIVHDGRTIQLFTFALDL